MPSADSYRKMSDEELVALYHGGDSAAADYIVEKYKNLVRMKARAYFLAGADNDDLIQEGMIGLFKAIRDYDEKRDALFMTFASLCVSRQIRTAVTAYNRKKNAPLNTYISFDTPVTDEMGDDARLGDVLTGASSFNPEDSYFDKERTSILEQQILDGLSKMEKQVLELYVEGFSYAEIAMHLDRPEKAVDNAVQRIRNKINLIIK